MLTQRNPITIQFRKGLGDISSFTLSGKMQVERHETTFLTPNWWLTESTLSFIAMLSRKKSRLARMLWNRPPTLKLNHLDMGISDGIDYVQEYRLLTILHQILISVACMYLCSEMNDMCRPVLVEDGPVRGYR